MRTHSLVLEISQSLHLDFFLFSPCGILMICMLNLLGPFYFVLQETFSLIFFLFLYLCAVFHELFLDVFFNPLIHHN